MSPVRQMFSNIVYPLRMSVPHTNPEQSYDQLDRRLQQIAQRVGGVGLLIVPCVTGLNASLGQITWIDIIEAAADIIVLSAILFVALRSHKVRPILYSGLLLLFAIFWCASFGELHLGLVNASSFPMVLFIPVFLSLALDYRLLAALAPAQALLVFNYAQHYGAAPGGMDFDSVAVVYAVLSGIMFSLVAILAWVRQHSDDELIRALNEKERLASTDSLTGLMNRRAFMDSLNALCATKSAFVVAFLDLDRFKPLNDQFGHAAGDAVLRELSNRLQHVPGVRAAARLGGDELAFALDPSLSGAELDQSIASLHAGLTRDVQWDGKSLSVGVSIGYAINVRDAQSLPTLLKAADTAMRRAKAQQSGWASFSTELDGAALDTHSPEIEFRSALARGDLRAAVQPIADAATLEIVGYEILSRWTRCGLRQTPEPNEFIPIAERLGLLNQLLWQTLDETLRSANLSPHPLAVNISPAQLQAPDFVDCFMNVLKARAVDPACITLEVTEQVAYRNIESNVQMLEKARRAGMTIALDDFGTGYSSLSMLDRLPLDKVKIDKSFSQRSGCSDRSDSILRASISLAKQLKLTCCVEGIETEEAARKVRLFGADEIQGYWIGRPVLLTDCLVAFKRAS
jgi:diguanylate cyclase (GGDEF)-like protein